MYYYIYYYSIHILYIAACLCGARADIAGVTVRSATRRWTRRTSRGCSARVAGWASRSKCARAPYTRSTTSDLSSAAPAPAPEYEYLRRPPSEHASNSPALNGLWPLAQARCDAFLFGARHAHALSLSLFSRLRFSVPSLRKSFLRIEYICTLFSLDVLPSIWTTRLTVQIPQLVLSSA